MKEALRAMSLHKAGECYLEARMSNSAAVGLYKKLGFQVLKISRGYYIDGENAYKMARKLPFEA